MSQPFPNYYLTRPNQVQVPLIPLDELLSLIHISEPTRHVVGSRMPSSA